jgi:stage IV sporulation protein FB
MATALQVDQCHTETLRPDRTMNDKTAFRFTLFGFPVEVKSAFFVISFLFSIHAGSKLLVFGSVALSFISILWHELGHAFAARAFGAKARIELVGGGGLTYHDAVGVWWKDLIISLAGPGAGLLLGAAIVIATKLAPQPTSGEVRWLIERATFINIGWSLVNLVPLLPYDGGNVLRAILVRFVPRGDQIAQASSILVGVCGVGYAFTHKATWIGYLAGTAGVRAYQELRKLRWSSSLDRGWKAWHEGDYAAAATIAAEAANNASDAQARAEALELGVWSAFGHHDIKSGVSAYGQVSAEAQVSRILALTIALLRDDMDSARTLAPLVATEAYWPWLQLAKTLAPKKHFEVLEKLTTSEVLALLPREVAFELGAQMFYAGGYRECLRISEELFAIHTTGTDAYNAACCESRLGNFAAALDWLRRAIAAGYSDYDGLDADEDLQALREHHGGQLRAALGVAPLATAAAHLSCV